MYTHTGFFKKSEFNALFANDRSETFIMQLKDIILKFITVDDKFASEMKLSKNIKNL